MEQKNFDLVTHVRHPKSGRVIAENHYKLVVSQGKEGQGNEWLFERPVDSGLWYYGDGKLHEEKSRAGLEKKALEEKERTKSAVQKARDAHERAVAVLKAAEAAHEADLKARGEPQAPGPKGPASQEPKTSKSPYAKATQGE